MVDVVIPRIAVEDWSRTLPMRYVMPAHDNYALLDLFEISRIESRFGDIFLRRLKAQRRLDAGLADQKRNLVVEAAVDRRPEGFLFASVGECMVGIGALIVTINTVYTSLNLRKLLLGGKASASLLRSICVWAKSIGAREVLFHATSGIGDERVGRGVNRFGFALDGGYVAGME